MTDPKTPLKIPEIRPNPRPADVVRLVEFLRTEARTRGIALDPSWDAAAASLAAIETDRGAALRLLRALPDPEKRPNDRSPQRAFLVALRRAAQYLHAFDRARPWYGSPRLLDTAATTALWRMGYAGTDVGSGRVCGATVRAVLAGSELP